MSKRNDLSTILDLLRAEDHAAPSVEILRSELRSDSGLEPPINPPQKTTEYVIIKWKYHIRYSQFDKFHAFLNAVEEQIVADVADLKLGAAYKGTYAELPHCIAHQTFWSYDSINAIDAFKNALGAAKKKSELRTNLKRLVGFIDDPTLTMHRLVRASALDGLVAETRKRDPILDLFAGAP